MSGFYRKFVPNYSTVVSPLTNLLKAKVKYAWSDECQRSFEKLKAILVNEPVLAAPNFTKPFRVAIDACDVGVGAVLLQEDEEGIEKPVCYFSKKLNRFQKKYSTIEKEALSLVLALQQFEPFEIREDVPSRRNKLSSLTIYSDGASSDLARYIHGIESGRLVARDIGGSDPERMAAPKVAAYMEKLFAGSPFIKLEVLLGDKNTYPLFAAVDRCAQLVERHRGRIIKLEYEGSGEITKTLMLVGKGVTYDTGGADIKAGGVMAGMHRDKCGAAAVAGFFRALEIIKPAGLKVVGTMAMVRNSVGVESYVSDEIILSRAGVRIRIGNTDAEGRMAMGDCLCEMKERALREINPHLMTIATLTGHAVRAMGPNYSIIMDNGPARMVDHARQMQRAGDLIADPFEISTIRREDYAFHKGKSEYEDVLQSNSQPSSMTARGHQSPAAFLMMASGLDKHGKDSSAPLPYSHIDIAGSSGPFPGVPTGAPIAAMTALYMMGF
nr:putative aminopeptidase W07G4.4 [Lytechinus pictus]